MEIQEILEYNKRCAEFLGKEYDDNKIVTPYTHFSGQNPTGKIWEECKYHSDWNWIMKVVEAIEKLGLNFKIGSFWITIEPKMQSEINYKPLNIPHSQLDDDLSKKEAVVQAINQFLIWHEQNK